MYGQSCWQPSLPPYRKSLLKSSQRKADIKCTLDPSVDPFLELSIMYMVNSLSLSPPRPPSEGNQSQISITRKKTILITIISIYLVSKFHKIIFLHHRFPISKIHVQCLTHNSYSINMYQLTKRVFFKKAFKTSIQNSHFGAVRLRIQLQ